MRTTIALLALSLALVAIQAGAAPRSSNPAREARDGWPDTPAGKVARGWVSAFSSGEPAFREFLARSLTAESLAKKSLEQRMGGYRELRERFGKLAFASVIKSAPGRLEVRLMADDASIHEFIFEAQTKAPWKLISVSRREQRGHGFGGFHH